MKCPFCEHLESKVMDSRLSKEGAMIRRRRECEECHQRFTTYERIEEMFPFVVKKDGRREPYDRSKVINGLQKACEKRPVSVEKIESLVSEIESSLIELGGQEIASAKIGEKVMAALKGLDDVAYIRFASVYRSFEDVGEFMELIRAHEDQSKLEA